MKKFLAILFFLFSAQIVHATDTYMASANAGSADGLSCANAKIYSSVTITGAGNTFHVCGTITGSPGGTALTVSGGGSMGSPVTIVFEAGAVLTATYWNGTNGAINVNGKSFVVVNGGGSACGYVNATPTSCNGTIIATANGTALANQQDSSGVASNSSVHNVEVKNLNVTNMYVRTKGATGTTGEGSQAIFLTSDTGGNSIHNNWIDNTRKGVQINFSGAAVGDQIYNNYIEHREAGIVYASVGSSNATGPLIHDNFIGSAVNWDEPNDNFHHDGIHMFQGAAGVTDGLQFYNNIFSGNVSDPNCTAFGGCSTALYFSEDGQRNSKIFNNIFSNDGGSYNDNAQLTLKGAVNNSIYNNTFTAANNNYSVNMEAAATGNIFRNNVQYSEQAWIVDDDSLPASSDYNVIFFTVGNPTGVMYGLHGGANYSFSDWKTLCGCDSHSVQTDPKVNATYHLTAGSSAIGFGQNLTSQGIAALDSDKTGSARPSSSSWDGGAYNFATGNPPSGPPPLMLLSQSLPSGVVGSSYPPFTLQASGGTLPYTWSGSSFPSGLSLSAAGVISGTPTMAGTVQSLVFVSDSSLPILSASATLPLTISAIPPPPPPPPPSPPTLTNYVLTDSPPLLSFSGQVGGAAPATQTVNLSDTSPFPIPFTVAASAPCSVSASPQITSSILTVGVSLVGLAAGSHPCTITVTAPDFMGAHFTNSPLVIPVAFTATAAPPPPPQKITLSCTTTKATVTCTIGGLNHAQSVQVEVLPGGPTATATRP